MKKKKKDYFTVILVSVATTVLFHILLYWLGFQSSLLRTANVNTIKQSEATSKYACSLFKENESEPIITAE